MGDKTAWYRDHPIVPHDPERSPTKLEGESDHDCLDRMLVLFRALPEPTLSTDVPPCPIPHQNRIAAQAQRLNELGGAPMARTGFSGYSECA